MRRKVSVNDEGEICVRGSNTPPTERSSGDERHILLCQIRRFSSVCLSTLVSTEELTRTNNKERTALPRAGATGG